MNATSLLFDSSVHTVKNLRIAARMLIAWAISRRIKLRKGTKSAWIRFKSNNRLPRPGERGVRIPKQFEGKLTEKHLKLYLTIQRAHAGSNQKETGLGKPGYGWVSISSKVFKEIVGSQYKKYQQDLIDWKLLLKSTSYLSSAYSDTGEGFTYSFKIPEEVARMDKVEVFIPWERPKPTPIEESLYENSIVDRTTIDPEWRMYAENQFQQRMQLARQQRDPEKREKLIVSIDGWMQSAHTTATSIETEDWWITKCVGERVHTPVTSMPKQIRNYLRVDGCKLYEIDIANSQPAILMGVVKDLQKKSQEELVEYLRETDTLPQKEGKRRRKIIDETGYYMARSHLGTIETGMGEYAYYETDAWKAWKRKHMSGAFYEKNLNKRAEKLRGHLSQIENLKKYGEDVGSGKFYEIIMESLGIPAERRPEVKTEILKAFYDKTGVEPSEIGKKVKSLYPEIYGILTELKREAYPAAAILMQRKESQIMRQEELYGLCVLFIHDAILIKKEYTEEARKVIQKSMEKYGVSAKLETKELNQETIEDPTEQITETWKQSKAKTKQTKEKTKAKRKQKLAKRRQEPRNPKVSKSSRGKEIEDMKSFWNPINTKLGSFNNRLIGETERAENKKRKQISSWTQSITWLLKPPGSFHRNCPKGRSNRSNYTLSLGTLYVATQKSTDSTQARADLKAMAKSSDLRRVRRNNQVVKQAFARPPPVI